MHHSSLSSERKRRGWTMEQLAREAGTTKGTISRLEAGLVVNPSYALVARLEKALRLRRGTLEFGEAHTCEVAR